ncbi:MAG: ABC transporter substrate-binding protein [Bacillota bacterium]
MNIKIKSLLVMIIAMVLLVPLLVGCQSAKVETNQTAQGEQPKANEKAEKIETDANKRTVVDQNGRTVVLPNEIKRVAVTSIFPIPSVFYMVDGSAQKLVGINPSSKSAAAVSMLSVMAPEIMKAETGFVKGADVNIEELMKLKPDIVIYRAENTPEQEKLEKTGIPSIAFKSASLADGNTIEIVYSWMNLLGQILGKESKVESFKSYANEALGMVHSKTWNIPLEKRPRALFLFRHTDKEINVAGTGHFGHFWLNATGAINVAADIKGTGVVNMEQIYKWDPEIIYITNFTETLPEDLLQNKVNSQDWSKTKAVKNGRVYKVPLGIYRWYPPSTDTPLMLKWLAQKNHPELFKEISIEKEIKDYYKEFYGFELNDEQVKKILNPPREAARE